MTIDGTTQTERRSACECGSGVKIEGTTPLIQGVTDCHTTLQSSKAQLDELARVIQALRSTARELAEDSSGSKSQH